MKCEIHGPVDIIMAYKDIYHWKIPLLVRRINVQVSFNEWKSYCWYPIALSIFQSVNSGKIVTSSITSGFSHCDVTVTDCSEIVSKPLLTRTIHHRWVYRSILLHIRGRTKIDRMFAGWSGVSGRQATAQRLDTRVLRCVPRLTTPASNQSWLIPINIWTYIIATIDTIVHTLSDIKVWIIYYMQLFMLYIIIHRYHWS